MLRSFSLFIRNTISYQPFRQSSVMRRTQTSLPCVSQALIALLPKPHGQMAMPQGLPVHFVGVKLCRMQDTRVMGYLHPPPRPRAEQPG